MNEKNKCKLIQDLLPLYVEGLVSETSKEEIEKHLKQCDECSKELKSIQKDNVIFSKERDTNKEVNNYNQKEIKCIKKIKRKIILRIIIAIFISIIVTLGVMHIWNTYRIIRGENGKLILYNLNTGNIQKGIDCTNLFVEYIINNNGKDIKYYNVFSFNKNEICINDRLIIDGYSNKEMNEYKNVWENSNIFSNITIENEKLYMNENSYIGKNKQEIVDTIKKSYDIIHIIEI